MYFLSGIYPSIEIQTKEIDERLLYIHKAYISQIVDFLIQGYDNPMGVATCKTVEDVWKVLPMEEELRKVMYEEGENATED